MAGGLRPRSLAVLVWKRMVNGATTETEFRFYDRCLAPEIEPLPVL